MSASPTRLDSSLSSSLPSAKDYRQASGRFSGEVPTLATGLPPRGARKWSRDPRRMTGPGFRALERDVEFHHTRAERSTKSHVGSLPRRCDRSGYGIGDPEHRLVARQREFDMEAPKADARRAHRCHHCPIPLVLDRPPRLEPYLAHPILAQLQQQALQALATGSLRLLGIKWTGYCDDVGQVESSERLRDAKPVSAFLVLPMEPPTRRPNERSKDVAMSVADDGVSDPGREHVEPAIDVHRLVDPCVQDELATITHEVAVAAIVSVTCSHVTRCTPPPQCGMSTKRE